MFETRVSPWTLFAIVVFAAGQSACRSSGSPGTYSPDHSARYMGTKVEPAAGDESKVLASLDELAAGKPGKVGGLVVVADVPYFAASGRTCRRLVIKRGDRGDGLTRLACKDGAAWFYAPDVFSPSGSR